MDSEIINTLVDAVDAVDTVEAVGRCGETMNEILKHCSDGCGNTRYSMIETHIKNTVFKKNFEYFSANKLCRMDNWMLRVIHEELLKQHPDNEQATSIAKEIGLLLWRRSKK